MAMSVVTLEQLPDDVHVAVMQFLSVEDVLACRLVCRRLCDLALHGDVWRHRSLADDHRCAGAVLHLAPCLDTLTVTGKVSTSTLAATTTRCAVASLEFGPSDEFCNPAEYAFIVHKQESLGRLRRLKLVRLTAICTCSQLDSRPRTKADLLARTVASCSGLESIEFIGALPTVTYPVVHGPPRPSLTTFRCPLLDTNSASFINTVLAGHAATLEEVYCVSSRRYRCDETVTVNLLAALPRLHSLQCNSSCFGFEAARSFKTLREVSINLYEDLKSVAQFLRQAKQLRHVLLINYISRYPVETDELVEALAPSSGPARVERLALMGFKGGVVPPLLRVLPWLPALRHLDVRGRLSATLEDMLLLSITPVKTPALRRLEFLPQESLRGKCPHAWIHGAAVRAALAANPLLHIQVRFAGRRCLAPKDCEACVCVKGCHEEVKWGHDRGEVTAWKIGLYSHGPDVCPSPKDHTDDVDWHKAERRFPTPGSRHVACTWVHM